MVHPLVSVFGLEIDPVLVAIVAVLLGFVFFVYLFLRRTVTGFQEGVEQARRKR
ncbi:hypothetical protein [Halapricum desulfuricans]|uniref:Uncharacterized protein n=1 Tax=Halapricum desulfuricans TaxID=2841257 RepID=A0A897N2A6_9EURY|nr:hypothetical protein [Halapricum desulfuricans]QSG05229.1 Uncharacterized protein HSR121_0879 [Halapricum desulfuricans]